MEEKFWHDKWSTHTIGFHQKGINQHLKTFWQQLNINKGSTIFVPLCGKSQDMNWIVEQGYSVIGVEISEIAINEFFQESNLVPKITVEGDFTCYSTENIKIYKGDYFKLTDQHLLNCSAVYDRASLIALPLDMRTSYCRHLTTILSNKVTILLITLQYNESELTGPPFAVSPEEVTEHFNNIATIVHLDKTEFIFKGVDAFAHTFQLTYD